MVAMELSVPAAAVWALLALLLTATKAIAQTGSSFSLNASLTTDQTWLSVNGTFTMGFQPIPANSSSLYLAVWYSGVPVVPVWLMQRERAVRSGATLTLTNAGNLVLVDAGGSPVWTSNTSALGVVGGQFLENGNIVLKNGSGATLWIVSTIPLIRSFLALWYVMPLHSLRLPPVIVFSFWFSERSIIVDFVEMMGNQ